MNAIYKAVVPLALVLAVTLTVLPKTTDAAEVPTMTKEELKGKMTDENVVILDVRRGRDWSGSEFKIQGAHRLENDDIKSLAGNHSKDKTLVLYCA